MTEPQPSSQLQPQCSPTNDTPPTYSNRCVPLFGFTLPLPNPPQPSATPQTLSKQLSSAPAKLTFVLKPPVIRPTDSFLPEIPQSHLCTDPNLSRFFKREFPSCKTPLSPIRPRLPSLEPGEIDPENLNRSMSSYRPSYGGGNPGRDRSPDETPRHSRGSKRTRSPSSSGSRSPKHRAKRTLESRRSRSRSRRGSKDRSADFRRDREWEKRDRSRSWERRKTFGRRERSRSADLRRERNDWDRRDNRARDHDRHRRRPHSRDAEMSMTGYDQYRPGSPRKRSPSRTSPSRRRERSRPRRRERSKSRSRGGSRSRRSPVPRRRSPSRRRSHTPRRDPAKSPQRLRSRTPTNKRSKSPPRCRSRTPHKEQRKDQGEEKEKGKERSKSPTTRRSKSPPTRRSRSPRQSSETPRKEERRRSRARSRSLSRSQLSRRHSRSHSRSRRSSMRHRSPFPRRFSPPRRRRSSAARKPTPAESPLVPPPLPSFSIPVAPTKDKDPKEALPLQQKQLVGERKAETEEPKKSQEESKKEQKEPMKDSAKGLKEEEPKETLNDSIQGPIPIDQTAEDLTVPPPTKESIPSVKQSSPMPHRQSRRSPSSKPQPKQKSPKNCPQARPDSPQYRHSHRRTPSTHPPSPKHPSRSPSPATLAAHNRAAAQTSAELITTYKKRGHFDQIKKDLFSAFLESPIKAEFSADLKNAVNAELDRDPSLMARDRTKAAAMIERSADANGIYDRVEEFVDEIVKQRQAEIEGMVKALCIARNITPNAATEIVKKQLMNGIDGNVGQDVDDEGDVVTNRGS